MKQQKLFSILLLFWGLALSANAQKNVKDLDIESLSFYGVDFSMTKVYASDDEADKLRSAFIGINFLFESEPKKYNVSKTFDVDFYQIFTRQVRDSIEKISRKKLFTDDGQYEVSDEQIKSLVRAIDKRGDDQYGAIIVADLLNKAASRGSFTFVIFNQNTNEIVFQQKTSGKARGFGLRNYWAGALYDAMKNVR